MRVGAIGWPLFVALGCGPAGAVPGAGSGEATTTSSLDVTSSAADETTGVPSSSSAPSDATTSSAGEEDDTVGFVRDPDVPPPECNLWEQDCPRGEKCMPWDDTGAGWWNTVRCSPVADDPNAVGEPCAVVGSAVSGIDDCVLGAMCWDVDPKTNVGECVALCTGSEVDPTCANPCDVCTISSGPLILCLRGCDPLAQDCGVEEGCYPNNDTFTCAQELARDGGLAGDPCEFINVCVAGNVCVGSDLVPGCADATGCCTPFCDAGGPDGCDALLPGTSCVPWFEEGQQPEQCVSSGIIGACMVVP